MKAISVENISKKFILAHDRPKNLADLAQGKLLRRQREEFWALKDVAFDVEQGEALGIIGHNGAGKSTMLKLLTKIMFPTQGRIRTRGRLSALIEVGAGFHPEMSGRENIFLNGSILGMSQKEIASKLDEIVAFAELEKFIDTPVKRYSSGMYARLGFAVAAHVDPEILIVDEVLSVGDLAFQERCTKRMQELGEDGRTIVFVSHNLSAVANLCRRVIILNKGEVHKVGEPHSVVKAYRELIIESQREHQFRKQDKELVSRDDSPACVTALESLNEHGAWSLYPNGSLRIRIHYSLSEPVHAPRIGINILDKHNHLVLHASNAQSGKQTDLTQSGHCDVTINTVPLIPGLYEITAKIADAFGNRIYDDGNTVQELSVTPPGRTEDIGAPRFGHVWVDSDWMYS